MPHDANGNLIEIGAMGLSPIQSCQRILSLALFQAAYSEAFYYNARDWERGEQLDGNYGDRAIAQLPQFQARFDKRAARR